MGVLQDAKKGQDVLDVGRFQEPQSPVLHEGDVPPGELQLEKVAVVRRPKQHGLPLEGDPLLAMVEDGSAHLVGLLGLVEARDQERPAVPGPFRPERLVVALR